MKAPLRAVWERMTLYLPILLMGVFALGTWWLVRSTPSAMKAVSGKPLRHEADYFLRGFAIKTFDGKGQIKSEVFGAQARHYPDTDTLEIEQVRMRSFNEAGRLTVGTANRAISDSDGSDVQLLGQVHVVRAQETGQAGTERLPIEFRSEFLHVFTKIDRMTTHLPVIISRGADRFSGDSLTYDNGASILELDGRVRGVLIPRKSP